MEKTPITPEFPLWPTGRGETLVQLFRSAAEQSAAEGGESTPGPRSPPAPRPSVLPSLQRHLYEADGQPLRLGRYEVIRCVGAGGMGVVYEAVNVEHGQRVALKTLRWMTGAGLARFKNEFRSLCGVAHPNLVALYELGAEAGEWFFTMELVLGQSFVEHAQGDGERRLGAWEYLGETFDEEAPPSERVVVPPRDESAVVPRRRGFHEGRLRAALRQLAGAIAALHDLGKLHRDLNPGNVLVTREGRVVLIDFGLVADRAHPAGAPHDGAGGTPAYMSPEQAAGRAATAASDWYGFGVMLFEALTGQLPFTGSTLRMLTNKRHQDAPLPSTLAADLPADLADLCSALLCREPEDRPDADAVLDVLGVARATTRSPRPAGGEACMIGRRAELHALHEALGAVEPARSIAVVARGAAGIGKTTLLAHFLDELSARGAVVLCGACGERETIPHRMLDGVVDALWAHLATLPLAEARALLPQDARSLACVFPVLEELPAITELPAAAATPAPGGADERAAFACLRELLARLSEPATVVLSIDDAHLGDREGARQLAALLGDRPGDPAATPRVLLLLGYESDTPEPGPVLEALAGAVEIRELALGPLTGDEAHELSLRALPDPLAGDADRSAAAAAVAAAAGGNPLVILELARHVAAVGSPISLEGALAARLASLPEHARRLLEIVAAGGPIERGVLLAVAGAGPVGDAALAALTADRLVCATGVGAGDRLRVRDEDLRRGIAARTPPAVARQIHLDLGQALAAWPEAEPSRAAAHLRQGGAVALAAAHLTAAAERAAEGGDPDRAAQLLEGALEHTPRGTAAARALSARRAEALARAGRSMAAASAYLEDLAGAQPAEALDRRRCAAEHLLAAGHIDEGLATLRPVLHAHGIPWPETPRRALWTLGARLVTLQLRGLRPVPATVLDRGALARVQALWSAGKGLATVDPVRAALFVVEALRAALDAGSQEHAALARALLGSMLVYRGSATEEARGLALIDEAARFARRSGDAHLLGFSWFCSGLARMCAGRFREALARVEDGLGLLEAEDRGRAWERNAHQAVCLQALFELGALAARARRAERWLREARDRGDRAGAVQAGLAVAFAILAAGDPSRARAAAREALALAWQGAYGVPHQVALWIEVSSLLYEGDAKAARARLLEAWPALRASQLLHIQLVRIEALHLRGLTAIAAGGPAALRSAQRDAERLARERRPHALAAAALLRAGVTARQGEIARAVDGLEEAGRAYAAAEMMVHAAAARRTRGAFLGGAAGAALVTVADAALGAEGVRDARRWAAMYTGLVPPAAPW